MFVLRDLIDKKENRPRGSWWARNTEGRCSRLWAARSSLALQCPRERLGCAPADAHHVSEESKTQASVPICTFVFFRKRFYIFYERLNSSKLVILPQECSARQIRWIVLGYRGAFRKVPSPLQSFRKSPRHQLGASLLCIGGQKRRNNQILLRDSRNKSRSVVFSEGTVYDGSPAHKNRVIYSYEVRLHTV